MMDVLFSEDLQNKIALQGCWSDNILSFHDPLSGQDCALLTILSEDFWPILVDVGNLIHAEEHGVVGTPLPIGFTACKERERVQPDLRRDWTAGKGSRSAYRGS